MLPPPMIASSYPWSSTRRTYRDDTHCCPGGRKWDRLPRALPPGHLTSGRRAGRTGTDVVRSVESAAEPDAQQRLKTLLDRRIERAERTVEFGT